MADEAKIWDYSGNAISKCGAKNAPSQFHTYYRKNAIAVGCRATGLSAVRGEHMRFYIPPSLLSVMQLVKSRDLFLLIPWFYAFFHSRITATLWCQVCESYTDGHYRSSNFRLKFLVQILCIKRGGAFHCWINRYSVLYIIEYSIKMEVDTIARLNSCCMHNRVVVTF